MIKPFGLSGKVGVGLALTGLAVAYGFLAYAADVQKSSSYIQAISSWSPRRIGCGES